MQASVDVSEECVSMAWHWNMNMELAWRRASFMHAALEVDTMARVALGSALVKQYAMGVELAYTKIKARLLRLLRAGSTRIWKTCVRSARYRRGGGGGWGGELER